MSKNRRLYSRMNMLGEFIQAKVLSGRNDLFIGQIRDISAGGISFYTDSEGLKGQNGRVVNVLFSIEDDVYLFEVRILRERRERGGIYKTLHAGEFNGLTNRQKVKLQEIVFKTSMLELI